MSVLNLSKPIPHDEHEEEYIIPFAPAYKHDVSVIAINDIGYSAICRKCGKGIDLSKRFNVETPEVARIIGNGILSRDPCIIRIEKGIRKILYWVMALVVILFFLHIKVFSLFTNFFNEILIWTLKIFF